MSDTTAVTPEIAPVSDSEPARIEPPKRLGWFFWVCTSWIVLVILAAIFANVLPLDDPLRQNYSAISTGPSLHDLLGTDDLGRDILSRLVFGARVSLVVGFGAMGIGLAIGGTLGLVAGYLRGWVDNTLNALSYVLLAFPPLVAVIAIVTFWGRSLFKITIIIGVAATPLVFRIIRASCLSWATREFVTASRSLGASSSRVLFREIVPNVAPAAMSFTLIGVATVIVLEGTLAFLGLSVQTPTPSWGNMLNEGTATLYTNPWLTAFPAIIMFLFLLALNLVGDKLRQHFDVTEIKL